MSSAEHHSTRRRTTTVQLNKINQLLGALEHRVRAVPSSAAVAALAQAAMHQVPDTRWVSVTMWRDQHLHTVAATAAAAQEIDALQRGLGQGPAATDAQHPGVVLSPDVSQDPRWPVFGPRVHDRLGVASLLTYRVPLSGDPETMVGLSLYSEIDGAFDEQELWATAVMAAQCAGAVSAQLHQQHRAQLSRALHTNREIGAAIGVLMSVQRITRWQAFHLLRQASQNSHRKLADLATEVVDTGGLFPPRISNASRAAPQNPPRHPAPAGTR